MNFDIIVARDAGLSGCGLYDTDWLRRDSFLTGAERNVNQPREQDGERTDPLQHTAWALPATRLLH